VIENIHLWAITPTYAVIYALLSWVVLCWERIWFGTESRKKSHSIRALLSRMIRHVFLMIYAFLGIFLLDVVIRICFSGLISYGRFGYVAAPVILCSGLGILYIVRCGFVAPAWTTLASLWGMVGAYLYITASGSGHLLREALYAGAGITIILGALDAIIRTSKSRAGNHRGRLEDGTRPKEPDVYRGRDQWAIESSLPLWDLSRAYNRVMNAKVYTIILLLLSIELVLLFEGRSLLYWL